MLIKWCKIQYLNLGKALWFPRNQVICLKNWKLWWAPTTVQFNIFCWNFTYVSVLPVYAKACVGFFIILFRSWVIYKPGLCECVETRSFLILVNNSSSKQNKKNSTHSFVDSGKKVTCAKFQQKSLKSLVIEARQSFQFFRHNTWFLKNNRALSKFLYRILHYFISITKF